MNSFFTGVASAIFWSILWFGFFSNIDFTKRLGSYASTLAIVNYVAAALIVAGIVLGDRDFSVGASFFLTFMCGVWFSFASAGASPAQKKSVL